MYTCTVICPLLCPIANKLIWSVSGACQCHKKSFLAAGKAKEKEKISIEKQVLLEEINDVNKCIDLQRTSETLDEKFVLCVKSAEEENGMNLFIKASGLKRRREEAQNELQKLQEALGILEEKQKNEMSD